MNIYTNFTISLHCSYSKIFIFDRKSFANIQRKLNNAYYLLKNNENNK